MKKLTIAGPGCNGANKNTRRSSYQGVILFFLSVLSVTAFAQNEEVVPLKFNPKLYLKTKELQQANKHRYLIDKGVTVVFTDTLNLPFVDDFSSDNTGTLGWVQNHITDTFYNVTGTCLAVEGVTLKSDRFMLDTAWQYSYDTITHAIDSVPLPSIQFTFFGPATSSCFIQTPSPLTRWPEYYTFTFDSTGAILDSTLVQDETNHPSELIYYAPVVYFAQGEPGKLWFDNYTYVNNTYPVGPPTIGVATLDGLNEYGLPYNNSSNHTYGTADYLTSKPINLTGLDTSNHVYLSFFYEPKGLGDYPDSEDSLLLEFRDNSSQWNTVWSVAGYSTIASVPDTFSKVYVQIPELAFPYNYFHSTFQFRFRNKASLYGNNDHWHIDYVILDKNRSTNEVIHDIAFVYPLPTLLKNFSLMPADQFNYPADLRDSVLLLVHNLDPNANGNPPATNFTQEAEELYPATAQVLSPVLQTFNAYDFSNIKMLPSTEYTIPNTPNWPVDSLVIDSRVFIEPANDSRAGNDTLYMRQHFDNVLAYDDGSAEQAYGMTGVGLKKFAYEFNLNKPDTLVGFQVLFSQVEEDVSNLIFNFNAWDSLKLNSFTFDDATTNIFTLDNKKPYYIDSINGFTSYKLDTPLLISDKIYFGWSQTDTRRLQVGYDLNSTLGRQHMFVFANGKWSSSLITTSGSPMIRLIFDSNYWGGTSAVNNLEENNNNISLFPNPTTGTVNIKSENPNALFELNLTNVQGQLVKHEWGVANNFSITELENGIYLLTLRDIQSGKLFHSKIIKTGW